MSGLDQLEIEDSGEFTLDPHRAQHYLSRQQLPGPHHYLLKLVQAGVAGGAQEIKVKLGWFGIEISLALPRPLPLEDLSRHLFCNESPVLRLLATGVSGALSTLRVVTLEQGGRRYVQTRKSQWEEEAAPRAEPDSGVLPDREANAGLRIGLSRMRWDISVERDLLARMCGWCPVPLLVNGRPLQIPLWGSSRTLVQSYVPGTALSAPGSSRAALPPRVDPRLAGRRIPCDMVLAIEPWAGARIDFVQHGVTICQRTVELEREGVVAVVGADHLPTDLGGFELLDGSPLEERIAAVRVEVQKMSERA